MTPALIVRLRPAADGTAELLVEAKHAQFAGAASAWFNLPHLHAFGEQIAGTYPLDPATPLSLEGGYWTRDAKSIEQLHVSLRFYPVGGTGTVGVQVQLASPVLATERPGSQRKLSLELNTNYEELCRFGFAVVALASGTVASAELNANEA